MSVNQFKLPDVGEGLTEAEIVSWKVKVGDVVKVNDIVVEIETAKSLVELPSPYAGTVLELLVPEGETVPVGTPIIAVGSEAVASAPADGGAGASEVETAKADEAVEPGVVGSPAPKADGQPLTLVGYGPRETTAKRRPRTRPAEASPAAAQDSVQFAFQAQTQSPAPEPAVEEMPASPVPPAGAGPGTAAPGGAPVNGMAAKVLAKPPVRKLARDLGVDLSQVPPTGPQGTITRGDVEAFAAGGRPAGETAAAEQPVLAAPAARETRIPIKGVRKMTAQAVSGSAFTAPHVTEWVTVDATRTVKMVKRLREHREFRDVKVSPLLVVARAVCVAVRRTPEVNAVWDEQAQEIVLKHYVNLGIAAATPRGLVVPNVKGADSMSAVELAGALNELTATARAGRTQPAEMSGGTFTITNVGVFGVDAGTPIINRGESAILCMGAIKKQPWVVGNKVKPRWVTTLALSFDHRLIDGEQGSRFLADVAGLVEDPGNALIL